MKTGQGGSFVPPSVHLAKGTAVPVSSNGSLPSKARKQWSRSKIIWVLLDNVGPKSLKICQKTVSYIKLSEICPKCVRKVSKMCQIQNSVQNVSDQNQKCLRNVSKVKNVSVNHQFRKFENCQNSIRKVSYDRFLTQFCTQIVNYYNKKLSENCQRA